MNTKTEIKIETETELFDALAKLGISRVEFTYKSDGQNDGTAFDEAGNKIDLDTEISDATEYFASERAEEMYWGDHEDSGDDWAKVTFDIKACRITLEGETVQKIVRYEPDKIFYSWGLDE